MWNGDTLALVFGETNWVALRTLAKGRFQNNFLPKVGNLAQGGGGGSDPIPTFFKIDQNLICT